MAVAQQQHLPGLALMAECDRGGVELKQPGILRHVSSGQRAGQGVGGLQRVAAIKASAGKEVAMNPESRVAGGRPLGRQRAHQQPIPVGRRVLFRIRNELARPAGKAQVERRAQLRRAFDRQRPQPTGKPQPTVCAVACAFGGVSGGAVGGARGGTVRESWRLAGQSGHLTDPLPAPRVQPRGAYLARIRCRVRRCMRKRRAVSETLRSHCS